MTESKEIMRLYNGFACKDDFVFPPGYGGPIPKSELNRNDVLSGRGGCVNAYCGNVQFRALVGQPKIRDMYNQSRRKEKAFIAKKIVQLIRSLDPPGRFLEEDRRTDNCWIEIGDAKAMEKVKQAMREMRRSSLKKSKSPKQKGKKTATISLSSSQSSCNSSSFTSQLTATQHDELKAEHEKSSEEEEEEEPTPPEVISITPSSPSNSSPNTNQPVQTPCTEVNDEEGKSPKQEEKTLTTVSSSSMPNNSSTTSQSSEIQCKQEENRKEEIETPPLISFSCSSPLSKSSSPGTYQPSLTPCNEEVDEADDDIPNQESTTSMILSSFSSFPNSSSPTRTSQPYATQGSNNSNENEKRRSCFHQRKMEQSCTHFKTPYNENMDISQEIILEEMIRDSFFSLSLIDILDSNDKL